MSPVATCWPMARRLTWASWRWVDPENGLVCGCGVILGDLRAPRTGSAEMEPREALRVAAEEARVTAALEPGEPSEIGIASRVHPADPIVSRIDVIDATQPYTPADVEQHLLEAVGRLERGAHYERVCAEDYAQIVQRYEIEYARAFVKAKTRGGTDKMSEQLARVEIEEIATQRMVAKMKLDAVKGTMHSLRSTISSYQSILRSVQTAYQAGGGGRS